MVLYLQWLQEQLRSLPPALWRQLVERIFPDGRPALLDVPTDHPSQSRVQGPGAAPQLVQQLSSEVANNGRDSCDTPVGSVQSIVGPGADIDRNNPFRSKGNDLAADRRNFAGDESSHDIDKSPSSNLAPRTRTNGTALLNNIKSSKKGKEPVLDIRVQNEKDSTDASKEVQVVATPNDPAAGSSSPLSSVQSHLSEGQDQLKAIDETPCEEAAEDLDLIDPDAADNQEMPMEKESRKPSETKVPAPPRALPFRT
ncbi:hypothetical protein CC86DRAFT_404560 [Ophiobolus disseminans]|uniref:Uncharacterized protein n=1 Tax=Ophiobolus disseminans TaxID=1469910 RepID=A0A6A7A5T3_9PLEO|nr:hypothetical protein CC86DRAFT_404560 [Ophiobolus disseminans]